jgi:photoactive yellow protein
MDVFPIESLMHFDRERFDELPFGIIEVDADGRIILYNRWEEELAGLHRSQVLGRLFFSEVAPCTGVAEFEGRFRAMVASGRPAREELDFVFKFPGSTRLVSIILSWAPAWNRGFILVRVAG